MYKCIKRKCIQNVIYYITHVINIAYNYIKYYCVKLTGVSVLLSQNVLCINLWNLYVKAIIKNMSLKAKLALTYQVLT